ncbi:transcriptional regulator [Pseudomonas sp. USTB-Z]|uniref:transcriptional regulator n=1 Tax=Pseudomonas TaxID=286 RepID=UPI001596D9D2|nr:MULTISPECIES: transcriptional regulator [Pseudomonas]MBF8789023.1 transcriptional regulator [Pseudomonas asiatica]MBX6689252.1 transcriptional regulator [Pseudomonas sp. USTB-Z]
MLRQAIAAALTYVRQQRRVVLTDVEEGVTAAHLSRVERGERGVSVEKLDEIARQLDVHPLTLLALAYGADQVVRPTDLLKQVSKEVAGLGGSVAPLVITTDTRIHARVAAARERREDVQRLKAQGLTKAEVARELGVSKQTVGRHWDQMATKYPSDDDR